MLDLIRKTLSKNTYTFKQEVVLWVMSIATCFAYVQTRRTLAFLACVILLLLLTLNAAKHIECYWDKKD